jgi:hypothetical protein
MNLEQLKKFKTKNLERTTKYLKKNPQILFEDFFNI